MINDPHEKLHKILSKYVGSTIIETAVSDVEMFIQQKDQPHKKRSIQHTKHLQLCTGEYVVTIACNLSTNAFQRFVNQLNVEKDLSKTKSFFGINQIRGCFNYEIRNANITAVRQRIARVFGYSREHVPKEEQVDTAQGKKKIKIYSYTVTKPGQTPIVIEIRRLETKVIERAQRV